MDPSRIQAWLRDLVHQWFWHSRAHVEGQEVELVVVVGIVHYFHCILRFVGPSDLLRMSQKGYLNPRRYCEPRSGRPGILDLQRCILTGAHVRIHDVVVPPVALCEGAIVPSLPTAAAERNFRNNGLCPHRVLLLSSRPQPFYS